jgi:hypothetical protein
VEKEKWHQTTTPSVDHAQILNFNHIKKEITGKMIASCAALESNLFRLINLASSAAQEKKDR